MLCKSQKPHKPLSVEGGREHACNVLKLTSRHIPLFHLCGCSLFLASGFWLQQAPATQRLEAIYSLYTANTGSVAPHVGGQ